MMGNKKPSVIRKGLPLLKRLAVVAKSFAVLGRLTMNGGREPAESGESEQQQNGANTPKIHG